MSPRDFGFNFDFQNIPGRGAFNAMMGMATENMARRQAQDPYAFRNWMHQSAEDLENKELANQMARRNMDRQVEMDRLMKAQMRREQGLADAQIGRVNQASPSMMLPSASNYWGMAHDLSRNMGRDQTMMRGGLDRGRRPPGDETGTL